MKVKATEQGLTIPKEWLGNVQEFEIRKEDDQIILIPALESDSIWQLGSDPISLEITDASEKHDTYLYQAET